MYTLNLPDNNTVVKLSRNENADLIPSNKLFLIVQENENKELTVGDKEVFSLSGEDTKYVFVTTKLPVLVKRILNPELEHFNLRIMMIDTSTIDSKKLVPAISYLNNTISGIGFESGYLINVDDLPKEFDEDSLVHLDGGVVSKETKEITTYHQDELGITKYTFNLTINTHDSNVGHYTFVLSLNGNSNLTIVGDKGIYHSLHLSNVENKERVFIGEYKLRNHVNKVIQEWFSEKYPNIELPAKHYCVSTSRYREWISSTIPEIMVVT